MMGHLNFLERRTLCVILVLASKGGSLTLKGRDSEDTKLDPRSFALKVEGRPKMGRLIIFRHDIFDYCYRLGDHLHTPTSTRPRDQTQ
eukprot:256784-Amphidinium_carterae.2